MPALYEGCEAVAGQATENANPVLASREMRRSIKVLDYSCFLAKF